MNLALVNISQLVTVASGGAAFKTREEMRDLRVIENAAVLVEDETIAWTGPTSELPATPREKTDILDCAGRVVMPGFVDSHTHLLFAGSREDEFAMRSEGLTYAEIASKGGGILNTVRHVRAASKKDLKKDARPRLAAMLRHGTTTVEIKSGYGLDAANEIKMLEAINELSREEVVGIVPTFLGAHAIPPEHGGAHNGYVREVTDSMIPYVAGHGLARFCDVFCEQGYFTPEETERILAAAKAAGLQPKIHAEELSPLGGALLAARLGAASADHLEHITPAGIEALARARVVATLLPGVSFFLNHPYAPARQLIDAGVPVALATDFNPGSCMSYSMPLMATIACTHMRMTPEEAITASTLNAAAALGMSREVGSIEPGKKADLITLDIPNYRFLAYHFGENHVDNVIKNGVVLEF